MSNSAIQTTLAFSKFTQLSDVPANYTGQAGNAVTVKNDESGLQFVAPNSTGGLVLITDTVLSSPAANFDFTSIPGTHKHLCMVFSLRSDQASDQSTSLVVNNDTGANYGYLRHYRDSATADAWGSSTSDTKLYLLDVPSNSRTAGYCVTGQITIPDYANTTFTKHFLCPTISGFTNVLFQLWSNGNWLSTAAITRLTFKPTAGNWQTGSRCSLYGLR